MSDSPWYDTPGEIDSPQYDTPGEIDSLQYDTPGEILTRNSAKQNRIYFNPMVSGPGKFHWWMGLKISLDCPFNTSCLSWALYIFGLLAAYVSNEAEKVSETWTAIPRHCKKGKLQRRKKIDRISTTLINSCIELVLSCNPSYLGGKNYGMAGGGKASIPSCYRDSVAALWPPYLGYRSTEEVWIPRGEEAQKHPSSAVAWVRVPARPIVLNTVVVLNKCWKNTINNLKKEKNCNHIVTHATELHRVWHCTVQVQSVYTIHYTLHSTIFTLKNRTTFQIWVYFIYSYVQIL